MVLEPYGKVVSSWELLSSVSSEGIEVVPSLAPVSVSCYTRKIKSSHQIIPTFLQHHITVPS